MEAYKTNTQFNNNLQAWFSKLPIKEGEDIEVIIIPLKKSTKGSSEIESLAGTVLEYNSPFEPTTSKNDWYSKN